MGNPRWLIGCLFAWIMLTIIGNIIEGAGTLTAAQVAEIQEMTEAQLIEAKDPDTGGIVTYGGTPKSMIEAIIAALTMDWAWLYDIDYGVSQATCEATVGAKWNSDISACQTPNSFWMIWAIIYWPIMIAILFELFILALRLIRGI